LEPGQVEGDVAVAGLADGLDDLVAVLDGAREVGLREFDARKFAMVADTKLGEAEIG